MVDLINGMTALGSQRREFLKELAAAGVGMVMMPVMSNGAVADIGQAIYFTWGGFYTDPRVHEHYKAKYGVMPETPTFADTEEALQKILSGFQFDVCHPCAHETARWREAGVIQPIDVSRLKNWPDVHPLLRNLPSAMYQGKQYLAAFEWGYTSIAYRPDLVKVPEGGESWDILWDPQYKGKVSAIDSVSDSWWVGAIKSGIDLNAVDDAAIAKVGATLRELRPNVRLFSSDDTTLAQALASGELVAAMSWPSLPALMRKQGVPVKFAKPKEGALNWVCGLVLSSHAPHPDKAYDLIDYMLSPDVGKFVLTTFGYGHSNVKAFSLVDDATLKNIGLTADPADTLTHGKYAGTLSTATFSQVSEDWGKIKAGF